MTWVCICSCWLAFCPQRRPLIYMNLPLSCQTWRDSLIMLWILKITWWHYFRWCVIISCIRNHENIFSLFYCVCPWTQILSLGCMASFIMSSEKQDHAWNKWDRITRALTPTIHNGSNLRQKQLMQMFATLKNERTVAAYDGIHGLLLGVIIMGKHVLLQFLGR